MTQASTEISCPDCGGRGFFSTAIHYPQWGLSPVTYCRTCPLGRQLLQTWSREPQQRAYARRLKADRIRRALELSQLGAQFVGRRLADLVKQPVLCRACAHYTQQWPTLRRWGQGLFFWGPVGSGKTHTAAAVVNELIEVHLTETLFLNVPEAAGRLRDALRSENNRDSNELLNRMKRVELLGLDALGLETPSAWVSEQLYRVIDERWRERRPMIVTSTLSLAELARRYPPQIATRLEACCKAIKLPAQHRRETG